MWETADPSLLNIFDFDLEMLLLLISFHLGFFSLMVSGKSIS